MYSSPLRSASRLSAGLSIVRKSQESHPQGRYLHASTKASNSARALPKSLRSPKSSPSAAGPSRQPVPRPSPSTLKAPVQTHVPPSTPTATSSNTPTPHRVSANTPSWPWRSVPAPSPGLIEEERVIYARPFEGPFGSRVRMLWFLVPFYGIVVGFYLTTPSLPRKNPPSAIGTEGGAEAAAEQDEVEVETPQSVLWSYTTPLAMLAITLTGAVALLSPSRFVTRLALIRQRPVGDAPAGGKEAEKVFVRMHHGGHLMMSGDLAKPRDLPLDQVKVRQIAQRSPYLSLKVTAPSRTRFSLDTWPYRLDFRDTAVLKHTDEEVVLSLQRIEQVFGRL